MVAEQPGEGRHDDAVGQLQVAQGDGGEQVHDGSKADGHGPHSALRPRSLRASKVSRVADPRTRQPGGHIRLVLMAGVLMGAAYNTRTIYLFSMAIAA